MDIIENSRGKDEIRYSNERFEQLSAMRDFNYENIYKNPLIKTQKDKIRDMFYILYTKLLGHVQEGKEDSPVFLDHINLIDKDDPKRNYLHSTPPELIVVDYIAGMTDDYFISTFITPAIENMNITLRRQLRDA